MFFDAQSASERKRYEELLMILWSLSNLFSDSNIPYLYYRWAERAFCRAFGALDHSRWDTAIDAGKDGVGIGLKTFLEWNGNSFQKVAEFNRESANFRALLGDPAALVREISRLRNERLAFAQRTHAVEELVYHCVARKPWTFIISEEKMDFVDVDNISNIDERNNTIHFSDGIHEYNFSITKSTLLKRFTSNPIHSFNVEILGDPFEYLVGMLGRHEATEIANEIAETAYAYPERKSAAVVLPLYSERWGKHVPERSWLNQWNARGRARSSREVYIGIPSWIHQAFPWFFPDRDTSFDLVLPNGRVISAKVCQDGSKALMSNPNTALGEWLIDDVLHLPEGRIVDYDMLERVGTDSVEISKESDSTFHINFKKVGAYDAFRSDSAESYGVDASDDSDSVNADSEERDL